MFETDTNVEFNLNEYNLSHLIRLSQLLEKFQLPRLPRLPSEITGKLSFLRKNTRLDEMTALLRTIERK